MNPHNIVNCIMQNRNYLKDQLTNIVPEQNENDSCKEVGNNKSTKEDEQCPVFEKLLEIRRNVLYRPSIKVLCQYPFTTFYWPQKVVDLIDLCYEDETFVFCYAGSCTEKFCIPNEYESKDIAVYILGCQVSGETIPLLHILTEEHSESIFKRFLDEMIRSKCRIPKRIVIEHLFFMIQAVVQRFTKSHIYEEFLIDCFTCLEINKTIKKSSCEVLDGTKLSIPIEQTKGLTSCEVPDSIDSSTQIEQNDNLSLCEGAIEDTPALKQNDKEIKLKQILPVCQVVIDIRSVIMTVQTWNFTDFANEVVKDCKNFILKVICSMSYSDNLNDFETILYKLLILLESKYENQLTVKFYNELSNKIKSNLEIECELNSTFQIIQTTSQAKIDYKKCEGIVEFFKNIRKQVKKDIAKEPVGILDNVFFNPTITIKLLELSVEFPVWTNVMDPLYNITSAQPSNFYTLKNYVDFTALPKNNCVIPIDEYLLESIAFTNERANYGIKHLLATTNRSNKRLKNVKQDDSHLTPEENWRNVNYISEESDEVGSNASKSTDFQLSDDEEKFFENADGTNSSKDNMSIGVDSKEDALTHGKMKGKAKKKGTLLDPCPQFCMLQQLPKQRTKKPSLIKNGNDSEKAVKVKSVPVRFLTTSPCDSLVEVIVSSFYLISKFQKYILEGPKTSILLTLIKEYSIDLKLSNFYRKRAEILSSFMTENLNEELYWNNSMAAFIEQSLIPSIKQTVICLRCKKEAINPLSFITIDCQSLSNENCILDTLKSVPTRYCTFWGNLAVVQCDIEHYLFCDVETSSEIVACHLNALPTEFSYNGKNFSLTGVIAFDDGLVQPIKHYIAYCRNFCNGSWTKYDDCSNAIEYCTEKQLTVKIAVLVYIEYELPITKALTEHSDAELQQNNNTDFQKSSVIVEDSSQKELLNDVSIIYNMNKENSSNELSLTELRTSDVEMAINVVTSTPERQQISISEEVVDLTLERNEVEINNKKRISKFEGDQVCSEKKSKMSKPKRKLIWKDMESANLTFHHPAEKEDQERNLNRGGKSRHLIRNGGRQIETIKIKIAESTYCIKKFKNTCAIDCIFEIMTDITLNGGKAISQDICRNKHKNETVQAIRNYSESFDMHQLLVYRAKLLFMIHCNPDDIPNNIDIDCQANVCSRFRSLMYSFPCVTVLSKCSSCGKDAERTEASISINCERFFLSNRIRDLQMLVQEELQDKMKHCDLCIQANIRHTSKVSHVIGNYLAIEMDFIYEAATKDIIKDRLKITLEDVYTNAKNIPLELVVNNKKIVLKGIVEFENPPNTLMHYIAYSRCLRTNRWIRYDDMLGESEFVRLNEMTQMKIALLLYVAS